MAVRASAALAAVAGFLVLATPALADSPFWTQRPELQQQGGQLVASNGGWMAYSGTVTHYVFRFVRDGEVVKGPTNVPSRTAPGEPIAGVYPNDATANIYALSTADNGHCFVAEVWGGLHSVYYYADGTLAYDWWEWGHLSTFGEPGITSQVCVGGTPAPTPAPIPSPAPTPPPPPPPPPPPKLAWKSTYLGDGLVGLGYSGQVEALNGTAATYALTSGALPDGLALSAGGAVTGIPTKAGSFTFTVRATDSVATAVDGTFTIHVNAPQVAIGPQVLPGGRANQPYSKQLVAVSGYEPYTFSVVSGALPKGVTLSTEGVLSGTPDAPAGTYAFSVGVTDKYGLTASLALVFTVLPPRMVFDTQSVPSGVRTRKYSMQLEVSGGSEPYSFRVTGGALPPGVKLTSAGVLRGTPTRAGNFGFTVQATDANGVTRVHYYGLRIRQR